jgi:AraC-like DNA-binding protein
LPEFTVSAGMAQALAEFAVARGADRGELLARAAIEAAVLEDHDHRVPFANYVALMRACKELAGDPALPLHFAEAIDMSEFSIVGLICLAAETMMEAFHQMNRYGRLVIEVDLGAAERFRLAQQNGELWVVDTRRDPNAFPELTETTFTRMVCHPRRFLPRPHVLEAHMTHAAPAHVAEYERIYQCPIVFGSHWNALRMDPAMSVHRVQQQPRYVFGVLCAHADALLEELESTKTTRGRVESLLMPILHTGEVSMDAIASRMAVSRQTLYRNLKEEGATFEQVLDELRRNLAIRYLSGKKVSVNETAYLVGFSEPAAFSRAFKRWTGKSPREAKEAGGA